MEKVFEHLTCNAGGPKGWKEETLKGRKQLVVNVVTITEGVHEGSQGKVYYSKDFLKKRPKSWDHKPAVVYHPDNKSACDPSILNTRSAGVQLETQYGEKDGLGRWKGRVWFDEEHLNAIDARVAKKVRAGEKVEVSTGLYVELKDEKGTWNGQKYDKVAVDYTPDHLAILPDKVGACSISKGAGLLQNEEAAKLPESLQLILERMVGRLVENATAFELVGNELSMTQMSRQLTEQISRRFGERGQYWRGYVLDVFSDYVVFENGDSKTYKLGYTATDSAVKLSDKDPVEVSRVVDYKPVKNEAPTPDGDPAMAKKDVIDALIKNGHFEEKDRKDLEGMSDFAVDNFERIAKSQKKEEPAPVVKNDGKETPQTPAKVEWKPTREEWRAAAPPEEIEVLNEMAAEAGARKEELIVNILAVKNCPYTREELQPKKIAELKKLSMFVKNTAPAAVPPAGQFGTFGNVNFAPAGGTAPAEGQQQTQNAAPVPKPLSLPKLPTAPGKVAVPAAK